ncbi:Unknown protein sequence [Pseudomonas savastanoi pv. phaseolicola]|uniref:Uncharacterized protein n=2 Tax=Pseudomonas savastanoi TaxID=29438 RepID=A0A3M4MLT9_PSESG|nr:Unknown protein sequence [Pseudomonas savastanoi pv. phaseolicola]KPB65562.1 Unknown protein sequence [Pseudomonas amygdali pv. mellea]RMM57249.1 hypothetical protein ALQ74_101930 [Pseudomonas savastanoi pv. glycinea]KPB45886.1 Unknown protein sequence [Pseudomonas savastanoi pv. phaseolicola]KPB65172.1 Unknown protein sequence [Pseudomonas savastanoi pv. phaseolicola]
MIQVSKRVDDCCTRLSGRYYANLNTAPLCYRPLAVIINVAKGHYPDLIVRRHS